MKKKIIAFCLLIAMICTFLIGCGLVETDDEKDLQRVIALVGDPDVYQDKIKKYELVNNYAVAYNQAQQGYGSIPSVEDLLNEMIYQRIKIQKAIEALLDDFDESEISEYIIENGFIYYEILGRSGSYQKDFIGTSDEYKNYDYGDGPKTIYLTKNMTIKDVLAPTGDYTTSEILTALLRCYYGNAAEVKAIFNEIRSKSDSDPEGFRLYYEAIKDSQVFSDHLIIGALNTVWGSEKSTLDQFENQIREESGLDALEEETTTTSGTRPVPKQDKEDRFILPNANKRISPDLSEDSLRRQAFNKYVNQIKKNFFGMSYSEFYEKQLVSELEQKALERHSELVIKSSKVDINEFRERFNTIKNSEIQGFDLDLNSYKTKLENLGDNGFVLYNPDAGVYGYVKHILLGLDTDSNKILQRRLDALKAKELPSRAVYLSERANILADTKVKDLREGLEVGEINNDIFPGYDDYPFSDHVYEGIDAFYSAFALKFGGGTNLEPDKIYKADIPNTLDEFEKWIYMYNTDMGLFSKSKGYLITEPNSMYSNETYMAEFAKASRDLIKLAYDSYDSVSGAYETGYYTLVATDYGYHLIILSDIITGNGVELADALDMFDKIARGEETEADKKTAAYKLYQIIKNERGQEAYTESSTAIINEYFEKGYYELFKNRYQDLLDI